MIRFVLERPDIFKVYSTMEEYSDTYYHNSVKLHRPRRVVRYFYPDSDLIEISSLAKGFNAFTAECDKYRRANYIPKYPEFERLTRTYMYQGGVIEMFDEHIRDTKYDGKNVGFAIFRTPGATRGSIIIDIDNRNIMDILFDRDVCINDNYGCYTPDVLKLADEFKNMPYNIDLITDIIRVGEAL